MAWFSSPTDVGLDFLSEMFGATPNISRVAFGTSTIPEEDLYNLTDVVDFLKDGSVISVTAEDKTTKVRVRVTNEGIMADTYIGSIFVFAEDGDGEDVLILAYTTNRRIPVDAAATSPGWDYEPQLNLTFSNGQLVSATIDWEAYAKLKDINDAVEAALAGYSGGIDLSANAVPVDGTKLFLQIVRDVTGQLAPPDFSNGGTGGVGDAPTE